MTAATPGSSGPAAPPVAAAGAGAEAGRFADLRRAAAAVAATACFVRVDDDGVSRTAAWVRDTLRAPRPPSPWPAPPGATRAERLAFVLTQAAVNFGSGWWPVIRKRPGCSGSVTLARALAEHHAAHGPLTADALVAMTPRSCALLFGQDPDGPAAGLWEAYARAWQDLGRALLADHGGNPADLVDAAGPSAARLVGILERQPSFVDAARLRGVTLRFAKRAQLAAADLHRAGLTHLDDVASLTLFADNLVPHVLRTEGVLRYDASLAARIDAGDLLAAGGPEEVELRAVALHAVERVVDAVCSRGTSTSAAEVDALLWERGQRPEAKARPRHRTRTTAY